MHMDGDDKMKATEASGIFLQIHNFKFLMKLIIFWRILSCTKGLSDHLQSTKIDMSKAANLVSATLETLQYFRTDEEWVKMYKYVNDVANLNKISVTPPRSQRQRRTPRRLDDCIIMETTGTRSTVITDEDYKITLYFPVLDAMIQEFRDRFENQTLEGIQCCHPESPHFLEINHLMPLVTLYNLNKESLSMECTIAKRTLKNKEINTINEVLTELLPLREAFPELVKLLQISLTIAVSTAECERSFSCLKRIKSYLRTTMLEQRLVDLAILSIEKELSQDLSLDEIVDKFAAEDKNRRIMLS